MATKFTMKMYYYSIYPEPLWSIALVYLHFQGGNLSKSNPFAAVLLLVIAQITSDY